MSDDWKLVRDRIPAIIAAEGRRAVTRELAERLGLSERELFELRNKKRDERGGFSHGLLLRVNDRVS